MESELLPCSGCKNLRVLKLGDYCRECALDPQYNHLYFIVKPDTLDHVARVSGMDRGFLNAKQEKAFEQYQKYVVYLAKDEWKDIIVSDRFPVEVVMKNVFRKLDTPS